MTNLGRLFKSRDITLPTMVHLVKAMDFPVVMYWCESWTIKKAYHQRIDAFELWCWRRLLRVPWTARRSNQSILKEINPGCSLEGQMLNLKFQYFATWCKELTHWKRLWCWERLRAGGEGDNRGWDGWMASLIQWPWVWVNSGSWWWTGRPLGVDDGQGDLACCRSWGSKELDVPERQNWTELNLLNWTYYQLAKENKKTTFFKANFIYILLLIFVIGFVLFFFILYFWESNIYSGFLIFVFGIFKSILYL